jgi:hypothetical protein
MPNETFCPELIAYMIDKMNAACNLQLKKPEFIQEKPSPQSTQASLF